MRLGIVGVAGVDAEVDADRVAGNRGVADGLEPLDALSGLGCAGAGVAGPGGSERRFGGDPSESGRSMIVPGFGLAGGWGAGCAVCGEGAPRKESGRKADGDRSIHSLSGEARGGLMLSRTRTGALAACRPIDVRARTAGHAGAHNRPKRRRILAENRRVSGVGGPPPPNDQFSFVTSISETRTSSGRTPRLSPAVRRCRRRALFLTSTVRPALSVISTMTRSSERLTPPYVGCATIGHGSSRWRIWKRSSGGTLACATSASWTASPTLRRYWATFRGGGRPSRTAWRGL